MLTNFKHGPEDEESPVPEDVRETLAEFHKDLLLHCGEKFCVTDRFFRCGNLLGGLML